MYPKAEDEIMLTGLHREKREKICKRAAQEIDDGMYVYLSKGFPKYTEKYIRKDIDIDFLTDTGAVGAI